jgi:Myotubularin-like phosphatase domain
MSQWKLGQSWMDEQTDGDGSTELTVLLLAVCKECVAFRQRLLPVLLATSKRSFEAILDVVAEQLGVERVALHLVDVGVDESLSTISIVQRWKERGAERAGDDDSLMAPCYSVEQRRNIVCKQGSSTATISCVLAVEFPPRYSLLEPALPSASSWSRIERRPQQQQQQHGGDNEQQRRRHRRRPRTPRFALGGARRQQDNDDEGNDDGESESDDDAEQGRMFVIVKNEPVVMRMHAFSVTFDSSSSSHNANEDAWQDAIGEVLEKHYGYVPPPQVTVSPIQSQASLRTLATPIASSSSSSPSPSSSYIASSSSSSLSAAELSRILVADPADLMLAGERVGVTVKNVFLRDDCLAQLLATRFAASKDEAANASLLRGNVYISNFCLCFVPYCSIELSALLKRGQDLKLLAAADLRSFAERVVSSSLPAAANCGDDGGDDQGRDESDEKKARTAAETLLPPPMPPPEWLRRESSEFDALVQATQSTLEGGIKAALRVRRVPLTCVWKIVKSGRLLSHVEKKSAKKHDVVLLTKDFRSLRLSFGQTFDGSTRKDFVQHLEAAMPRSERHTFAFAHFKALEKQHASILDDIELDGWRLYNEELDLRRIGCNDAAAASGGGDSDGDSSSPPPNDRWRISTANHALELCDTYPRLLGVPATVTDDMLLEVKAFRSRGRLPALVWLHPATGASMTRCAQPLAGLSRQRCESDEQMLDEIAGVAEGAVPMLYLMDARPRLNAMANAAMGAGVEGSAYKSSKIRFLGIGNIHVMRGAMSKLLDAVQPGASSGGVDSSQWLDHIALILHSATRIARMLHVNNISVLAHCSDGWDRTPQLTALTQLMLDAHYRTIEGFGVLVEKDWLAFSHKFSDRNGLFPGKESEMSPVFLQFLDAVYQCIEQYPTLFEFNSRFLVDVADAAYSCQYGTFLCNSPKERRDLQLHRTTLSFWTSALSSRSVYTNPRFDASCRAHFFPNSRVRALRLWTDYYLRHDYSLSPPSPPSLVDILLREHIALQRRETEHCQHIEALQERIRQLESLAQ